jgi:hypothetical protein
MSTYTKQMQQLVREYRLAGEPWPAATKTMAAWAIRQGKWELPASAAVNVCAEDIATAMREEYMTDAKGRRVRVKHPVTKRSGAEQYVLWDDIRTAPRPHMQLAFQQRRVQVFNDCRQLKKDVDSYNDAHADQPPIQMIFDFTKDLEEDAA